MSYSKLWIWISFFDDHFYSTKSRIAEFYVDWIQVINWAKLRSPAAILILIKGHRQYNLLRMFFKSKIELFWN